MSFDYAGTKEKRGDAPLRYCSSLIIVCPINPICHFLSAVSLLTIFHCHRSHILDQISLAVSMDLDPSQLAAQATTASLYPTAPCISSDGAGQVPAHGSSSLFSETRECRDTAVPWRCTFSSYTPPMYGSLICACSNTQCRSQPRRRFMGQLLPALPILEDPPMEARSGAECKLPGRPCDSDCPFYFSSRFQTPGRSRTVVKLDDQARGGNPGVTGSGAVGTWMRPPTEGTGGTGTFRTSNPLKAENDCRTLCITLRGPRAAGSHC